MAENAPIPARGEHFAVAPIALQLRVIDGAPSPPSLMLAPVVAVESVLNPCFVDLLEERGATQVGPRSFRLPTNTEELTDLFEHVIAPTTLHWISERAPRAMAARDRVRILRGLGVQKIAALYAHAPTRLPVDASMLILGRAAGGAAITVATRPVSSAGLRVAVGTPDLNLLGPKQRRSAKLVTPDLAVAMLDAAARQGFDVVGDETLGLLRAVLSRAVTLHAVPGAPALCRIVAGTDVVRRGDLRTLHPLLESRALLSTVVTATRAIELASVLADRGARPVAIDETVADVARMALVAPANEDGLLDHQRTTVAIHKTTRFGLVNASATGLGKTVMTLAGCRARAGTRSRYRALVVLPAHLRLQWRDEINRYFPEAIVTAINHAVDIELPDAEDLRPHVVVTSHALISRLAESLAAVHWHDLICDEAEILRSPRAARARALWRVRANAETAVALTATPVVRDADDLRRIAAWARGDQSAIDSRPWDPGQARVSLGPVLVRPPVPAGTLPTVRTEVVRVIAHPAEVRLAEVARAGLREMFERIKRQIEAAAALDPDDPELRRLNVALRKTRGQLLGQITVARMAASDPIAVAGSNAAAARMLGASGDLDAALAAGGTKRRRVSDVTAELCGVGEAVLIFTEFVATAKALAADLSTRDVRAGLVVGGRPADRARAVADFQTGASDALVCTAAGQEGLNLQRASVVIHMDLPWLFSALEQRVGRAARIGSSIDRLDVLVPLMSGTIEERVLERLIRRGGEALLALDAEHAPASPIVGSLRGLSMAVRDRHAAGLRHLLAEIEEIL